MTSKFVYFFGGGKAEGDAKMKSLLGGKGANLAEMTNLKLPVPPGFTITTEVCDLYYKNHKKFPAGLQEQIDKNLQKLEKEMGKKLGDVNNPLLVSVRSGAAASMPGMMDTVLNLGLNDESLKGLIKLTGNPRFGWDAYRRFIQMFGDVVMNVPHDEFEHALQRIKDKYNAKSDTDLKAEQLQEVVTEYKRIYKQFTKEDFPADPKLQLTKSINAVFGSWNNPRAIKYREINDIKGLLGTAVNVQSMVFGNMGNDSGTGVCFTRDPSTGENKFYGEFLMNAQGEDVVAGIRTPESIDQLAKENKVIYEQLVGIRHKLETHYKDMQDMEFTIEKGRLFILQTRNGKRTAIAAVRAAVEMVNEKLIDKKTALLRIDPQVLDQLLHPMFDPKELSINKPITKGLPASPGAAVGQVVFNADDAEKAYNDKTYTNIILVRIETSPEDIGGMNVSKGILTARGGMTSHAAVVARGMGKCCVAGCSDLKIDYASRQMTVNGQVVKQGDWISLNGSAGTVYIGKIKTIETQLTGPFGQIMAWADEFRKLGIRTNADTPEDTKVAVKYGAEGIGLCRTEHMFFDHPGETPGTRIKPFRQMIMVAEKVKLLREALENAKAADDSNEIASIKNKLEQPLKQYNDALAELLPLQRKDFEGIFITLEGKPCTVRLLDPPLHEFLPQDEKGQQEMAQLMNISVDEVKRTVESLHEFNPMLGHRGCRLGLTYPEITEMQVRAIIQAAINVKKQNNMKVYPEIMVPLVGTIKELEIVRVQAETIIADEFKKNNVTKAEIPYMIGTMIEVPRAAVTADEIAKTAEFFSFGTNDLTQMGCGFSRDDAGKFLGDYVKMGIYEYDPFQVLDQSGVGKLVEMGVKLGRSTNKNLKVGICGEHGGEPKSVKFCHKVGLNYVSCSPYRLPIARLAAAQAAIQDSSPAKKETAKVKTKTKPKTKVKIKSKKTSAKNKSKSKGKKSKKR